MDSIKKTSINEKKLKNHYSFICALLLSFNLINASLDAIGVINLEIGKLIGLFILIYLFTVIVLYKDYKININVILIILYLFIIFFISFLKLEFYDGTLETLVNFLFYGVTGLIVASKKIEIKLVTKFILLISLMSFISIGDLLDMYSKNGTYNRIDMGLSYAILPIVISGIIHFIFFRKESNILIKISYLYNIFLLYLVISEGSRGVFVSLIIFSWLLTLNKLISQGDDSVKIKNRKGWLFFSSIFGVISISFLERIIIFLYNVFISLGINNAFIEKNYYLLTTVGDISNNRTDLYKKAYEGIIDSPVFGNGIGSFQLNTGEVYVHNLILDMIYEFGLLLSLPILLIILIGLIKTLNGSFRNQNYYLIAVLLISTSIPRLMISASFWNVQSFWLLLGFLISSIYFKKNTKIENKIIFSKKIV